jgi:hypothetical protein
MAGRLRDLGEQVAVIVRPAPLPGHAGQAPGDQAAQECQPPGPVLAAGHVDAEDLPMPAGVHPGRDQAVHVHRPAAIADLLGQGVDPDEGVRPPVQRAGPEPLHELVQLGRHRADLRLAQPGHPQRGRGPLHPPGRHAQQAGRGHDLRQRPLRAAAVLQERREVTAVPQLRDRQPDGAGPGAPLPVPVAVAGVDPARADFAVAGAARYLDLGVHHLLGKRPDHLPQHVRRRRHHRLLEGPARNGHNVNYGHFALPRFIHASRRIARWPPHVTATRRTAA